MPTLVCCLYCRYSSPKKRIKNSSSSTEIDEDISKLLHELRLNRFNAFFYQANNYTEKGAVELRLTVNPSPEKPPQNDGVPYQAAYIPQNYLRPQAPPEKSKISWVP